MRGRAVPLEKAEQQWGIETLQLLKFVVFVLGHPRAGAKCQRCGALVRGLMGTQQTEGTPDVFAFTPPTHDLYQAGCRDLLWWEVKRERGSRVSDEQRKFAALVADMHCDQVHHVTGTYNDLIAWLIRDGWARADQFPHYRHPKEMHS